MTVCTFHDTNPETQERVLFEIVESAYSRREKVLIYVQDTARAAVIDRLLWIMKQEAFIPHRIFDKKESDDRVPVAIVSGEMNPIGAGILVADGHCRLDFACDFPSIHEFVNRSSVPMHQACRDRYREYRSRQVPVEYSK